ncbi:MAG: D-alanyl-D-alanine carboxypeptidase [Ruminococcaceae bacterium]|nr:D-alanyl-D-alanine carboxypeptidase [Oscillospiraceae bacterium]
MRKLFAFVFSVLILSLSVYPVLAEGKIAVSARAAVLMEASSGDIVFSKDADTRMPMASTTKIMTALVALEKGDLQQSVQIAEEAVGVEGSSVYLTAGETLTLEELLYALLLESANDAAAAVACAVSGSIEAFSAAMNEKAAEIGLENTHFTNPHGLDDEEHYTTASDLAKLAVYAMQNPDFARICSTYKKTIPMRDGEGTRLLLNHNRLLKQYADVVGVKTGFTKRSGRCLVSAAEKDGVRLVAVTLNAPDDWQDHRAMLDYGFSQYSNVSLAESGEYTWEIACTGAPDGKLTVTNTDSLSFVCRGEPEITHIVEVPHFLFPPVQAGETIGTVRFFNHGTEIGSLPLTAAESVEIPADERGFFEKLFDRA